MTDWIFQGNRTREDLESALATSPLRSWRTPRYRDRTAAGDRVWVQLVGRPFAGFQGSTVPVPADIAAALQERTQPWLDLL
jgi:hypothetical protein